MSPEELVEYRSKIKGYLVASRGIPDGRYYKNHDHARFESHRQAKNYGSGGIREVFDQEWFNAIKENQVYVIQNHRNRKAKEWEQ